jgi:GNAT superfamily N-acetyltransferase
VSDEGHSSQWGDIIHFGAQAMMPSEFSVRKATIHDLDMLFSLAKTFATSFLPEREAFDHSAEKILSDDAAWLGVALFEEAVVGYCLGFDHFAFYANGRVSWVEEIVVAEHCRRRGIGRALMGAFEAWARTRNSKLIALATRRAAEFYDAIGYENSASFFRKLLASVSAE